MISHTVTVLFLLKTLLYCTSTLEKSWEGRKNDSAMLLTWKKCLTKSSIKLNLSIIFFIWKLCILQLTQKHSNIAVKKILHIHSYIVPVESSLPGPFNQRVMVHKSSKTFSEHKDSLTSIKYFPKASLSKWGYIQNLWYEINLLFSFKWKSFSQENFFTWPHLWSTWDKMA